jgi:hypothetical protein
MIVANAIRVTRNERRLIVDVQCKYGVWYTVLDENFGSVTAPTVLRLPDVFRNTEPADQGAEPQPD